MKKLLNMIIDTLIQGFYNVIVWFINLLPEVSFTMPDLSGISNAISYLYYFLTKPFSIVLLSSLIFWFTVQPFVSLIKFIYRKIPGIN